MKIWKERRQRSEISGKYLGNEPKTYYFHHLLPKRRYPELVLDEENIILVTEEEHMLLEKDMYYFEIARKRIEKIINRLKNDKNGQDI